MLLAFTVADSKHLHGMSFLATDLGLCGVFFFFLMTGKGDNTVSQFRPM